MTSDSHTSSPTLGAVFRAFLRLGMTAFGGPAMVPYIRAMAITRGWVDERGFRTGMALCQAVPGATAMQVAAYVGLRARGLAGALAAYLGFGLPAFVLIVALSVLYVSAGSAGPVLRAFDGLKFVVTALVAHAALDFSTRYLKLSWDKLLALVAGVVLGLRGNPIMAIGGVCLVGLWAYRGHDEEVTPGPVKLGASPWRGLAILGAVVVLVAGVLYVFSPQLFSIAWVMFKVDLFAFGGGYVSLPLMLHEVTTARGWMTEAMFMDGIALGQITPGPIVITSAFVGYVLQGLIGATVGAVFAFTPSLLILVAVTPYFDRLQSSPLFRRAVRASLASLVGLLAAVAARFALAAPWSPMGTVLFLGAFLALRLRLHVLPVVVVGAALSVVLF